MVCEALKDKIELAELLAPCIVIFDDIDLSLGSRKKGMVSGGLAQFLDVLDGTEKIRKDVGIIATTNSLELLDMAAQRPGRFDKLLSFDSLTKSNIKNIILKSLKYNFEIDENSPEVAPFITSFVVDKFHQSRVTGSHVYNTTKMLYLRIQTLELENITSEWVVNEIKLELDTLARIRKTDYLNDKMTGNSSTDIGFPMGMSNSVDEDEDELAEEVVAETKSRISDDMSFSASEQGEISEYKYRAENESPVTTEKISSSDTVDRGDREQTERTF
jgi:SpoVK/Ycf46/Vps4 family AAA+-type ATPase